MENTMKTYISEVPEIIELWSNENTLNPNLISLGSNKRVLWKCDKEHSWDATVKYFVKNRECPYCLGRKATPGETDLETLYPNLKNEWNDEKEMSSFLPSSSYKAQWKCKINHVWKSTIEKRAIGGQNCPYCSNHRIAKGYNDLETLCPELLLLWDYDRNNILPSEVSKGSHKKIWWKCELGHSWLKEIYVLTNDKVIQRCPYCSNHRVLKGFNDLATTHPCFLSLWDYDKNKNTVSPTQVTFASGRKVWWKCSLSHSWKAQIAKIVSSNRGCPYCSNPPKLILSEYNDLATKNPEVLRYWDYSKNTIDPTTIAPNSGKIVWWRCELKHKWEQKITKITNGNRCPYCSGKAVLKGFNDLLTFCPKLTDLWIEEKEMPAYHKGSETVISILCPINNKPFLTTPRKIHTAYPLCSCNFCKNSVSKFEKNVEQFIRSIGEKTELNNRSIISPKELDIVIEEKKIAIECNGTYWHSDAFIQKNRGISAKDHHQMKRDLAAEAGYDLFFVWEDDWKNRPEEVKSELLNIFNSSSMTNELLNRLE